MILDSAITLALATVSLSRSLYDKMSYEQLQKYLQDYNYKYKNTNFEDARNILLEAKYYNPLTYTNSFINHNLMFANMDNTPLNNYKSYSYTREIKSNNGNGYIKEENYSYNGKDKPNIIQTYRTIINGKVSNSNTIKN
jgi:hypothetical protein